MTGSAAGDRMLGRRAALTCSGTDDRIVGKPVPRLVTCPVAGNWQAGPT